MHSSTTTTLIDALRILSTDIVSDDGIANAAIAEAADRLESMRDSARKIFRELTLLNCRWHDEDLQKAVDTLREATR